MNSYLKLIYTYRSMFEKSDVISLFESIELMIFVWQTKEIKQEKSPLDLH